MSHKILVIDDYPETLESLVLILQECGYDVISSQWPAMGLQLAENEKPDLLLVDMNMPEIDGLEVARRVRAMPHISQIPIVMFTGAKDIDIKRAGFAAGVDDYINKPTDPEDLISRVEALLQHVSNSALDEAIRELENDSIAIDLPVQGQSPTPTPSEPLSNMDGQLIVLCGARGGVGTTTVAINLACVLALAKHPTVLVDFDLRQGHIGLYLNQTKVTGLNDMANVPTEQLRQRLSQHQTPYRNNLNLLLTRSNMNGRHPIPTATQISIIVETLLQSNSCVIADLGLGVNSETQPVVDRADHFIICLPPERLALTATKHYLADLKTSLSPHTTLHVLLCDMKMDTTLPYEVIEKYISHPFSEVLQLQYEEVKEASNQCLPIAYLFPKSPLLVTLYKLGFKLVPAPK